MKPAKIGEPVVITYVIRDLHTQTASDARARKLPILSGNLKYLGLAPGFCASDLVCGVSVANVDSVLWDLVIHFTGASKRVLGL